MTRLPLLVQRSVAESRTTRAELSENYELQLRSKLSEAGVALTCAKGCNHCCRYPVFITVLEGITLYQSLRSAGQWSTKLREDLQRHSDLTRGLALEVWALSLIPCPLLDAKGLCRAYDDRPFACRVTYSIGNPDDCHPHRLGPGMLAKRDLFESITPSEAALLARHRLNHFRLPLSTATLYGERLDSGDLELEDCLQALREMSLA